MSLGPTVLRSRKIPFTSLAAILLSGFFVVQALVVDGQARGLSLLVAAAFAAGAVWTWFQRRRSAVLIDADQFIVKDGGRQRVYDLAAIEHVDLSSLRGHVVLSDGRSVSLPLEGDQLIQAGLLLTPPRRRV